MSEFDRHRERYTASVDEAVAFSGAEQEFYLRVKARRIIQLARDRLGPNPSTLDVGCGIGLMHGMLQDLSPRLFGIDVAPRTLAQASKKNPGDFVRYGGSQLPFAEGSFDLVFAVCVMHHVAPTKWHGFAEELSRVTRAGGLVVVFEHNPLNPLTRLVVSRCALDEHSVLLGRGRVRRLFEDCGLGDIEQRHILFFPWEGALWRRLEGSLGWLPLGAQYYVAARKR